MSQIRSPWRIAGAAAATAGVVLFVWAIRQAGVPAVINGVRRVGAGILVVFGLGGLRALIRTVAWRLCLDRQDRLPLGSMFAIYLAGDAIGNVTPFGFFASEPSKIVLVRRHTQLDAAVAALAIENLVYGATVVLMLVTGTGALLALFAAPGALRAASIVIAGVALLLTAVVAVILKRRRPVVSDAMAWLIRHGVAVARLSKLLPRVRAIGKRIFTFLDRRPDAGVPLLALEMTYHAAGVVEIWFTLLLIAGSAPPLLTAFVLEYVNRAITIVFQFVPMWLGVDEAGTGLATTVFHLGAASGVSLAIVRKARVLFWTAIGIVILLRDRLRPTRSRSTVPDPRPTDPDDSSDRPVTDDPIGFGFYQRDSPVHTNQRPAANMNA